MKRKVIVGSTNPVKINSVGEAFSMVFPKISWEVTGVDVASGVSNQPNSNEESIHGARNRAKHALMKGKADFSVGLEGGLENISGLWFTRAWIVVQSKIGDEGIGSTISMYVPSEVMRLIEKGVELGHANDKVFGMKNSKHAGGHFGLMTNNIITREKAYTDGIISALAVFLHKDLR